MPDEAKFPKNYVKKAFECEFETNFQMTLIPTKKLLHKNTKTENNVTYLTDVQILSQNSFSFCRPTK